jgi:hypothetical protein
VVVATAATLFVFRNVRDKGFGGQHERCDGCSVLQRGTGNLGRIDDAGFHQVFELISLGVVAVVVILGVADLADDDCAFFTGVGNNLAERLFQSAADDIGADLFVVILELQGLQCRSAANQGNTTTRDNAFFHGSAGRVHCVFHAGFLFLHFGFSRGAHFDHRNATNQLRQTLLELLAIVIAGGVIHLSADFLYAAFNLAALAFAFHDRAVVFINRDFLGAAQVRDLYAFQLQAQVFRDGLAAGEDGNVLQHGFAAIAEARRFHAAC